MIKKLISLFLLIGFVLLPACAENLTEYRAKVNTEFDVVDKDLKIVEFITDKNIKLSKEVDIPPHAKIKAQVVQFQKERRWHKAGFIICKLLNFTLEGITVDISQYDTYLIAKKYVVVDKKEAAVLAKELIITSGASIFAPGADVGYFFAKGAIERKKDSNWFKAGVMSAYENSICWFWLKGRPINLSKDDEVKLEYIDRQDARSLSAKIKYKKDKKAFKEEKKLVKAEIKEIIKELKEEEKALAYYYKQDKKIIKLHRKIARAMEISLEKRNKLANKAK